MKKQKASGIFQGIVVAACVCAAFLAASTARADSIPPSYWTKNISYLIDPEYGFNHTDVKMASSGNNFHLFWYGRASDFSRDYRIFHARSTDGGSRFEASSLYQSTSDFYFEAQWNNVVADGAYVHAVFISGANLLYTRSADNGATFDPVKSIYACDDWSSLETTGLYVAAKNGRVAVGWGHYRRNTTSISVICSISNDNGASFTEKQVAHSTEHLRYYVDDLVMSGDNIYVLYTRTDTNSTSSQSHLYLAGSTDGGATFQSPVKVNLPAVNDGYYAPRIQDGNYSPNIAASGNTAYVVWNNNDDPGAFDGWWAPTLRVRKTTDGGATLGDSVILKDYPDGYHSGCVAGLETVAICGAGVIVTTSGKDDFTGTWVWRSADGTSWPTAPLQLSTSGWWPMIACDPVTAGKVHIVNYRYYVSKDGGATFNGGEPPQVTCSYSGEWNSPTMLVDAFGAMHYAAQSSLGYMQSQALYRKVSAPPAPGAANKALSLVNADPRYDNMQVPATADLNPTSAMTMELWGRLPADAPEGYTSNMYFAYKSCPSVGTSPSYSLGLGDPGFTSANNIKCRILKKADTDADPVTIAIEASSILPRGVWTHLAMTYDAGVSSNNLKLYVNGAVAAEGTAAGNLYCTLIDSPLFVGMNSNRSAETFLIDELRIWNKSRTQAEIQADMKRSLTGTESGLCAYYTFNDTTRDITGRGNDGVLHYMETFVDSTIFTSYVSSDGDCGGNDPCYTTIQAAVDAAGTGAVILIAGGNYTEAFTLNAAKTVTLQGGWNAAFTSQTGVTILSKAPKAPQGSLTLQELTIRP